MMILFQLVNKPSRKENFFDLIFSFDENIIENVIVREPLGTSDHNIIEFQLVVSKTRTDKVIQNFNYHKTNCQDIIETAICNQWENLQLYNVNDVWLAIKSDILHIRNSFIP